MARTYGYSPTPVQRAAATEQFLIAHRVEVERVHEPVDGADAYRIATQCTDVTTGATGTFLMAQTARKLEDFVAVGPVFRDFYELLMSVKAQGGYTNGAMGTMRVWLTPAQLEALAIK